MKKYTNLGKPINVNLTHNTSIKDKLIELTKNTYLMQKEDVIEIKRIRALKYNGHYKDYINEKYERYILSKLNQK